MNLNAFSSQWIENGRQPPALRSDASLAFSWKQNENQHKMFRMWGQMNKNQSVRRFCKAKPWKTCLLTYFTLLTAFIVFVESREFAWAVNSWIFGRTLLATATFVLIYAVYSELFGFACERVDHREQPFGTSCSGMICHIQDCQTCQLLCFSTPVCAWCWN